MPSIARFEEIEAWVRARTLARLIYNVSGRGNFSRDFALRDQIRRAAISILSNIAEGFERGRWKVQRAARGELRTRNSKLGTAP